MSKCISLHGEYSDHEPDGEFVCGRCFAFDEEAVIRELSESRARFADSEAKRAELEAAIQKVRGLIRERTFAETLATDFDGNLWPQMVNMDDLRAILAESPPVVLQDRDREVAARALEEAADKWLHGAWGNTPRHRDRIQDRMAASQYAGDWLHERAAAYRADQDGEN